ncbi:Troponin I, cardiac muscle [Liparis tanakae]|uniref:Troponin I, cardiac muscle n=1 Tax=Liparis tanakae TaxID=230148 RepID=A0A4Z2FEX2_9TELE|nr:Troponin I, cardiac muscle [Liparis tanakae]
MEPRVAYGLGNRPKLSADALPAALLGSELRVSMDLRGNLRQVKKEVEEESSSAPESNKTLASNVIRQQFTWLDHMRNNRSHEQRCSTDNPHPIRSAQHSPFIHYPVKLRE